MANRYLFNALFKLCYFEADRVLVRINYRDMDSEELGSVYESLLELIPRINVEGQWRFGFMGDETGEGSSGHARKLSGSYYTPDSLVQELIRSALEPVIKQRLDENPANPQQALLAIRVCDPACGSGHFLLAAVRRLAAGLARIEAGADQPSEADYRHALRQIVRHCIYGVDINPLAVELCRTALWLEAIEPGKSLGFLDAHIRVGNSLVGVLDPRMVQNGIPDDAYKPLTGDSKSVAAALKRRNKVDKRQKDQFAAHNTQLSVCAGGLEVMPEESLQQIEHKRDAWRERMQSAECQGEKLRADLFTSVFFAPKTEENAERVPTNVELAALERGEPISNAMREQIAELAEQNRFFHWFLAFPGIFERGGFDVMLGNPPWDMLQFDPKEFFSTRNSSIANARHMADRESRLAALVSEDPKLYSEFAFSRDAIQRTQAFVHGSGRFPLTSRGRINLAPLFAEFCDQAHSPTGRSGIVVPSGIATDSFTQHFFRFISKGNRLVSLFDLENREKIFPAVDSRMKFSLLTLGTPEEAATLVFFATQPTQIRDPRRRFHLTAEDFALINPNTRTCPVFRSERDAELTKKLYRAAPVLILEATEDEPEINPWGIRFQLMFMMNTASYLFHTHDDLASVCIPTRERGNEGAAWEQGDKRWLPLYEAKMVHHYDHRWATYETDGNTSRDCTLAEKQNPDYHNRPRYWVDEWQVTLRAARAPKPVLDAAKKEDGGKLKIALCIWAAGMALLAGDKTTADQLLAILPSFPRSRVGTHTGAESTGIQVSTQAHGNQKNLFIDDRGSVAREAEAMAAQWPMEDAEYRAVASLVCIPTQERGNEERAAHLEAGDDVWPLTKQLLESRRPKYLLGWRDICRATDERTVIARVIPLAAVGNNLPLAFTGMDHSPKYIAALRANLSALALDFVARHKVGGTHLNFFIFKQLPVLAPDQYTQTNLDYIIPRVLELTYTSHALKPFAEDLGYYGEPFPFDLGRRHQLKCELDAYYAKLYGLTRDELRYILDPADVMGEDYPSETFRVLKKKEINQFGEYRTQRLVLEAWDKMVEQDGPSFPRFRVGMHIGVK